MKTLKIGIILGSTRPGHNGEAVAKWVHQIAQERTDAEFELVDLKDFNLPLLDEPTPPIMGQELATPPSIAPRNFKKAFPAGPRRVPMQEL